MQSEQNWSVNFPLSGEGLEEFQNLEFFVHELG